MKKGLSLFLAAVFCMACVSCGMAQQETIVENSGFLQQTQGQQTAVSDKVDRNRTDLTDNRDNEVFGGNIQLASQTVLTLHITINPELVVFSDAFGLIIAQQPLNEDAKTLLTAADVMGKPMEVGVATLLEKAQEQGFIKDGTTKMQLAPTVHNGLNWTAELEAALTKIVTDFETEKQLQIDLTVTPPQITETSGDFTQQADTASVKEWTDSSTGEHYKVFYNELGQPVRSIVTEADGTIREHTINPETETSMRVRTTKPDGSYSDNIFDENGVLTTLITMDTIGNYGEQTFDASGIPTGLVTQYADGRGMEIQYYENGKYKRIVTTYPDGMVQEDSYNEEETIILTVCRKSGEYCSETTYFANGMPAKNTLQYDNGEYSVCEYYETGGIKYYAYDIDGAYFEEHRWEDESLSYSLSKSADGIREVTWDEDGTQYEKWQYADGTESESQTDAAGNPVYQKMIDIDGNVAELWFRDGAIIKIMENGIEVPVS